MDELLTLEEVKQFLRIDFEDDDDYINSLITTTRVYIEQCVGTFWKDYTDGIAIFKILSKKLIFNLYENRDRDVIASEKSTIENKNSVYTNMITLLSIFQEKV